MIGPTEKQAGYDAGYQRGKADGSWVIDGNTDREFCVRVLEQEDDDIMDLQPNPLSGEWAGESIKELSEQYELDDLEEEEIADQFEQGYSEGFWDEVIRAAKAMVGDDD